MDQSLESVMISSPFSAALDPSAETTHCFETSSWICNKFFYRFQYS